MIHKHIRCYNSCQTEGSAAAGDPCALLEQVYEMRGNSDDAIDVYRNSAKIEGLQVQERYHTFAALRCRGGSFLFHKSYCEAYRPSARRGNASDTGM